MSEKSNPGGVMGGFVSAREVKREELDWGALAWFSGPAASGSDNLVVLEVTLNPGCGHDFHKHPRQDESIYVLEGEIEQWIDRERRMLKPGDSAFMGSGVVHASFNPGASRAKILAILGPCVGPEGYELIDVAVDEPWASIR
jgi:quercetin dioxygenase-like cupin family protein